MSDAQIAHVEAIECRLELFDWAYARDNRARIDAHWQELTARRSALFDGRVLLLHRGEMRDGIFDGACFETPFSRFIAWRDFGFADPSVRNFFGMAALRAADGAFLLGEMGPHTSSAGQVYFPAGTPDPSDLQDGRVDLAGSVMRELAEETGLMAHEVEVRPGWTMVTMGGQVAFMREIRVPMEAEEVAQQMRATLAGQKNPELSGIRIVRSPEDAARLSMPAFMLPYLTWAFAAGSQPG